MTRLNIAAIAASALFVFAPLNATAAGNFYVGGSIGSASLTDNFDGFNVDSSSTAFRLVAGWQFNDYFSLEGGYHNFGTFKQTADPAIPVVIRLRADGFTLGATGNLPLGEKFAIYGRAGSFFWDGDASINDVTQATPADTNLFLGAGLRYKATDRWSILGDWTHYQLEDTTSDVVSIGFTVGF